MGKYRVLSDINAGEHKAGDIVHLPESEAALMPWALERLADEPKAEQPEEKAAKPKSRRRKKE